MVCQIRDCTHDPKPRVSYMVERPGWAQSTWLDGITWFKSAGMWSEPGFLHDYLSRLFLRVPWDFIRDCQGLYSIFYASSHPMVIGYTDRDSDEPDQGTGSEPSIFRRNHSLCFCYSPSRILIKSHTDRLVMDVRPWVRMTPRKLIVMHEIRTTVVPSIGCLVGHYANGVQETQLDATKNEK